MGSGASEGEAVADAVNSGILKSEGPFHTLKKSLVIDNSDNIISNSDNIISTNENNENCYFYHCPHTTGHSFKNAFYYLDFCNWKGNLVIKVNKNWTILSRICLLVLFQIGMKKHTSNFKYSSSIISDYS